jgi:hypothetical protein
MFVSQTWIIVTDIFPTLFFSDFWKDKNKTWTSLASQSIFPHFFLTLVTIAEEENTFFHDH